MWPEEINWEIVKLLRTGFSEVVLSFQDTLKAENLLYSPDFNLDTLVVGHCVGGGHFEFRLIDTVDFLFGADAGWKLSFNSKLIRQGKGSQGEGVTPFSYTVGLFGGVSIGPTPAPFVPFTPKPSPLPEGATAKPTFSNVAPNFFGKTESPMASGTPVSFPEDPPVPAQSLGPPPGLCFSGSTTVLVKNIGAVEMRNLKIGDLIAVGGRSLRYEPVYSFGHYEPHGVGHATDFLEIRTDTGAALRVSRDHLIFVLSQGELQRSRPIAVPALTIQVGDELMSYQWNIHGGSGVTNNRHQVVKSIEPVLITDGLYSPFTPSGKFLVAGKDKNAGHLLVSSYISFGDSYGMSAGWYFTFSYQWLAHSFEFPHRMVCHFFPEQCENETYTEHGVSIWVARPFHFASWVLQLEDVPKNLVMMLAFVILSIFRVLGQIHSFCFVRWPVVLSVLLVGSIQPVWFRCYSSKCAGRKA